MSQSDVRPDTYAKPRTLWEDNGIQFARLLAEINATQDIKISALCESMDLSRDDVNELFDRAELEWERVKDMAVTATRRFPNDPEAVYRYVADLRKGG